MICTSTSIFVLALSFTTIQDVFSFNLRVEPAHLRIGERDNVTIICHAEAIFSDCQFTWWDVDDMAEGPHFDFRKGPNFQRVFLEGENINYHLAGYEYAGLGLENGQCGIRLYGVMLRYRVISCRARQLGGGWEYASMSLCSHSATPIDFTFEPERPIALPTRSITFLARFKNPMADRLKKCSFSIEGMRKIVFDTTNNPNTANCNGVKTNCRRHVTSPAVNPGNVNSFNSRVSYHGQGLHMGECGITIQNITERENGWLYFEAETEGGSWDRRVVHLTVASPPKRQALTVNNREHAENAKVAATCSVQSSRPVSSIKWVIGNKTLREDGVDDTPANKAGNATWKWDHKSQSILQTIVFYMNRKYDKKFLKCIVTHRETYTTKIHSERLTIPSPNSNAQSMPSGIPIRVGRISCPALATDNRVVPECKYFNRNINCTGTLYEGTHVNAVCRQGFTLTGVPERITCRSGNWSGALPVCVPEVSRPTATCPALSSTQGLTLVCSNGGKPVDCNRPMTSGTEVRMDPQCNSGFTLRHDPGYRTIQCLLTGKWDKPILECERVSRPTATCPALSSTQGLILVCSNGGRPVDCNRPMTSGTEVTMDPQCNSGFTLRQDPGYRTIQCHATGKWDKPILECERAPRCGVSKKLDERHSATINKPASYGEFPWHVAIYKRTSRDYEQICSGSLIAMDTVITAATCFWKDRYDENGESFNSSIYKVVAGKIRRSWDTEEEHAQVRDIKSAKAPERYTGRDTSYQSNIAKVTLTSPMEYSNYVNVVCVDWDSERDEDQLTDGQQAFVPGWAFAEEDSPGEILSSVTMPFIKYEDCNDALRPDLRRFFTGDKFCAGSTKHDEGFTMCDSDHGSGIVFYSESLKAYDLLGISSVPFKPITNRDTCYASKFGSFTTLSVFARWIKFNEE